MIADATKKKKLRVVDRVGHLIDRALLPFAPRMALKRTAARIAFHAAHYEAARFDRTLDDFTASLQTADAAMLSDLPTIIARARVAFDNYPWAKSIGDTYQRKVVGAGILPIAAAIDESGRLRTDFNKEVQRRFGYWARKARFCDLAGRSTYFGLQRQAIAAIVHSGEMFIHRAVVRRPGSPSTLKLQALEVDQLNIDIDRHGGNEVRRGVELDEFHAPVAYHFLNRPDNDFSFSAHAGRSIRIPADQITPIYDPTRPNQTHGIPHLGVVLVKLHQLDGYEQAELLAARMQACIGLILNPKNDPAPRGLAPSDADTEDADGNRKQAFQPGMIYEAEDGFEATPFNPSRPNTAFPDFERAALNAVAAGANLSRSSVSRDFSEGTFASTRQTLVEDRAAMSPLQAMMIDGFCADVWTDFVTLAVLDGDIKAAGFFGSPFNWTRAEHIPPIVEWIDPLKEVTAVVLGLRHGITSLKRVAAARGCNYLDLLDEQAEVERERAARGLTDPDARSDTVSSKPVEPDRGSSAHRNGNGHAPRMTVDSIAERLIMAGDRE